jgi:hypothetical protein
MPYSRKTMPIIFGKPQIAPHLAGFSMMGAPKNALIGAIGWAISGRIGLYYYRMKRTSVLGMRV